MSKRPKFRVRFDHVQFYAPMFESVESRLKPFGIRPKEIFGDYPKYAIHLRGGKNCESERIGEIAHELKRTLHRSLTPYSAEIVFEREDEEVYEFAAEMNRLMYFERFPTWTWRRIDNHQPTYVGTHDDRRCISNYIGKAKPSKSGVWTNRSVIRFNLDLRRPVWNTIGVRTIDDLAMFRSDDLLEIMMKHIRFADYSWTHMQDHFADVIGEESFYALHNELIGSLCNLEKREKGIIIDGAATARTIASAIAQETNIDSGYKNWMFQLTDDIWNQLTDN